MDSSAARPPRRVLVIGSSSKWRIATLKRYFTETDNTNAIVDHSILHFNEFVTLSPDIDEKSIRRDVPEDLCLAIAEAKMDKILSLLSPASIDEDAGAAPSSSQQQLLLKPLQELFSRAVELSSSTAHHVGETHPHHDAAEGQLEELWILTGDQVAVYDNIVREKPQSRDENVAFLQSYRGSSVATVAGTVLVNVLRGKMNRQSKVNRTKTTFRSDLPDDVIHRVIDRGDSLQCCGGFVVDDVELREFIDSVEPSFDAVTGLDMIAVSDLMREMHNHR